VNSLPKAGRGEHKRCWGIEMNNAAELYLKTYSIINMLEEHIPNANIGYRS
jgi:hypothetical protein